MARMYVCHREEKVAGGNQHDTFIDSPSIWGLGLVYAAQGRRRVEASPLDLLGILQRGLRHTSVGRSFAPWDFSIGCIRNLHQHGSRTGGSRSPPKLVGMG